MAAVEAGGYHTCALTTGGAVQCWGYNFYGELGNNSTTDSLVPVPVSDLSSGVAAVAAGGYHTCALTTGGAVLCWGSNLYGQLGNNSTTDSHVPVPVSGLSSGVAAISAGLFHTCAVTTGGAAQCWGYNPYGQLGNNSTTDSPVPVPVSGLSIGVAAIAVGDYHTCAVTTGGAAQCWGSNFWGELGKNPPAYKELVPVPVSGLSSGVAAITAGFHYTCALTTGGAVQCWGINDYGQLGDNSTQNSPVPVPVSGLSSGVAAISAGLRHICAVTTGGAAQCWGYNPYGQLGNNSTTDSSVPVQVSGLSSSVAAISAGRPYTCALTTGGAVQCWGSNHNGQLGNGTTTDSHVPTVILQGQSLALNPPAPAVPWTTLIQGATTALTATATSGLATSFDTWTPATCSVSGGNVTATGAVGSLCGVRASQAGVTRSATGTTAVAPQQLRLMSIVANAAPAASAVAITGTAQVGSVLTGSYTYGDVNGDAEDTGGTGSSYRFVRSTDNSMATAGDNSNVATGTTGGGDQTYTLVAGDAGNYLFYCVTPKTTIAPTAGDEACSSATVVAATYTVTYDGNGSTGGSVPIDASSPYTPNAAVTVKPVGSLVRSGYTFSGWNTAANGSGTAYAAAATFNIGGNTTLYAQWTLIYTGPWNQSINFDPAPSLVVKGTGTVSASATSGLPVTLASSTPTICSLAGNTLSGLAVGTCTVTANQSGNGNYYAAPQVSLNIAVGKGSQTITFGAAPTLTVGAKPTVTVSASSGLSVNLSSKTTGVCTVSGTTITGVAIGTCTIAADQAGNADYNAAPQVTLDITVGKGSQTITFGTTPTLAVGTKTTLAATASSGLPVSLSSRTTGVCTISGTQITAVAVGTCTIAADQAGNTNYNAAPQVMLDITVGKGNQTITFGSTPTLAVGAKATVAATASSGLPVSLSSKTSDVCTLVGTQVTSVTAGTCTIAADQAGNSDYNAATQVTLDILIDRISSSTKLTASPVSPGLAGQATSFTVQVTGAFGTPKGSVVFKDAGATLGTISLDSTGSGTYSGNLDIGQHELTASYAGDAVYLASQGSLSYRVTRTIDPLVLIKTDPNPSPIGKMVTVTVSVTSERNVGTITGTVKVSVDDGQTCKITLPKSPTDLDCILIFNSKGIRQLTAKYSGNSYYSAATVSALHYVGLNKPPGIPAVYMLLLD